ncbi:MAG: hypothetical protein CBD88_08820 [Flavobacteriales bacterium TMED228]|nr:MAG: hypothetical protein CBD88_08820 [Flavobacteriales bacterium TMED228]
MKIRRYRVQLKVGKKSKVVKEAEQQVANLKTSIDMMANIIELAAIDDKHALELQSWIKEYTLDIELLDAQITEVATHE